MQFPDMGALGRRVSSFARGLCLCALVVHGGAITRADDWPQFMGPQRDAEWRETGVLERFPANGPKVLWRAPIGGGYSGPSVANGRVFVMDRQLAAGAKLPSDPFPRGEIPGSERVLCFDEQTGRLLWKHEYDCPYTISYPAGPRVTPTVAEGRVFTVGAEGHLFCFDEKTGAVQWSHDFKKEFNWTVPMWGASSSPLVDGRALICVVGGEGTTVMAFDTSDGKELWRSLSAREPGYCPPAIIEAGGQRQLLVWHGESINSLNPQTGKVYWTIPIAASYGMSIALPRKSGDLLFLSSYKDHSMMLQLDPQQPRAKVLWEGKPKMSLYTTMATPYFDGESIYGTDADGEFRCIEAKTGKRLWETYAPTTGARRAKWGTAFIVRNGDRYFLFNELGDLIIARLSPEKYEEVSRAHILAPTTAAGGRNVVWSHPAFANRKMFARNDEELVCVSLAAE